MTSHAFVRRRIALTSPPPPDKAEVEDLGALTGKRTEGQPRRWRAGRNAQIAAAIPFVVTAVLYVVPGYYDRLFVSPPDIIGVPFGLVLQVVSLAWAVLGVAVVTQTRFRFMAALALSVCTMPAVFGVAFAPGLVEMMRNLG